MIKKHKPLIFLLLALTAATLVCFVVVRAYHLPALSSLKYASLFVASISGLWGMNNELYTKDDAGKRHLLLEGWVSVGITLVALILSFVGSAADDIKTNNEKSAKASNDKLMEVQKALNDARYEAQIQRLETRLASTQNDTKRIILDQKVLNAITKQNGANQRIGNELNRQQIREASNQQQSLTLRGNIRATAQNVDSLHKTLNAIDRTISPVGEVLVAIEITVPINSPELSDYKRQLAIKLVKLSTRPELGLT